MDVSIFNFRTGRHTYKAVQMPDGRMRAVWPEWDGPEFAGYYTKAVDATRERTGRADYLTYCELAGRIPAV